MFAEGRNLAADLAETGFRMMADLCDKPLVNMESAMSHPCQALADWHTLDELRVPERGKFVLSWANHPRALPLAVPLPPCTWLRCAAWKSSSCARRLRAARARSWRRRARPASVRRRRPRNDRSREALSGAHVIYAKEWGSPQHYGDNEADARLREYLGDWCVKDSWFKTATRAAIHALPAGAAQRRRRGRSARRPTQRRGARSVQSHGRADGRACIDC